MAEAWYTHESLRRDYPEAVLIMRHGDFWEMYDEDAELAVRELGLAMTVRQGTKVTGFPGVALDVYLLRLVRNRHRVAVAWTGQLPHESVMVVTPGVPPREL